jgi:hypothetical protein
MMKYLILLLLVTGSSAFAADYSSVRCEFKDDSKMEKVFGKFKKMQAECCKKRLDAHEACDSREEYQKCKNGGKGTIYAVDSGEECSEGCKLFREDCDDLITTSDVNRSL